MRKIYFLMYSNQTGFHYRFEYHKNQGEFLLRFKNLRKFMTLVKWSFYEFDENEIFEAIKESGFSLTAKPNFKDREIEKRIEARILIKRLNEINKN